MSEFWMPLMTLMHKGQDVDTAEADVVQRAGGPAYLGSRSRSRALGMKRSSSAW